MKQKQDGAVGALVVIGFLFLFLVSLAISQKTRASESHEPEGIDTIHEKLQALLDSLQIADASTRRSKLKNFLLANPEFEEGYLNLLEEYQVEQQADSAKDYFQNLGTQPLFRRNSQWMLGKLFAREKNSNIAKAAFTEALKAGPPTPLLLKDYIVFDSKGNPDHDGAAVFEEIELGRDLTLLIRALYSYYDHYDYKSALNSLQQLSAKMSRDATILHIQGYCHLLLSDHVKADSLWQMGLRHVSKTKNLRDKTQLLLNLGYLNLRLGKRDLALDYYNSAYTLSKRLGYHIWTQTLSGNLAFLHRDMGSYSHAERFFQEAIDLGNRLHRPIDVASWYRGYGMMLYLKGRYLEAIEFIDKCEALLKNTPY
ncbi:tetratricopeptide repeat protein, partial [bacterium]|nr:tetratricopeptide repeat protein [bacterium]